MTFRLCQQAAEKLSLCTIHRWNLTEWADDKIAAGCSKRPSSKAAASEDREVYPLGYVEDLNDARTPHGNRRVSARQGWEGEKGDVFSILLVNNQVFLACTDT